MRPNKIDSVRNQILELAAKGYRTYQILKMIPNVSQTIVSKVMRAGGYGSFARGVVNLEPYKDFIFLEYESGNNVYNIGKQCGVSDYHVIQFLKKHNIEFRPAYHVDFDENFFSIIDTEAKAYFLGLMYSDGHNEECNYCVEITMADRDCLEKFQVYTKHTGLIRELPPAKEHHKIRYRLRFNDKKFSADLTRLGCVHDKSYTLKYPYGIIPDNLFNHFIRGLIDGDGTIIINRKRSEYKVGLVGTENLVFGVKEYLEGLLGVHFSFWTQPYTNGEPGLIGQMSAGGRHQIKLILDYIYKDATVFMDRKKLIYDKFLEICNIKGNKNTRKVYRCPARQTTWNQAF